MITSVRDVAVATFAIAGATSAALALAARLEGARAVQPLNATSHWLHGDRAACKTAADARYTGVGAATHIASSALWAGLFVWLRGIGRPRPVMFDAAAVTAAAAVVDYAVVPARLTPGWEHVVSKTSIAAAYAAMFAALVLTSADDDSWR